MKKRELIQKFKKKGWTFFRECGNHEIWQSPTGTKEQIPRHREVDEGLAKALIRKHKL